MSEIPIKNIGAAICKNYRPGVTVGQTYRVIGMLDDGNIIIINDHGDPHEYDSAYFLTKEDYDHVNPEHYKTNDKEVWEYMIEIYGLDKFIAFCELNVFKYSMRVGRKPGATVEDDLGKIKWYAEKIKELRDDKGA